MQILGIDNVFFHVGDLEKAITFYERIGFTVKMRIPQAKAALLQAGKEEPGLILREFDSSSHGKIWFEVPDAAMAKAECERMNIEGHFFEIATGFTFEIKDPWNNHIGFADYKKKPELGRKN